MKSPYTAAVAIAERALDAAKAEIAEARERLSSLEVRADDLQASMTAERLVSANTPQLPRTGYLIRAAAELASLCKEIAAGQKLLEQLRSEGIACYSSLRALQLAEERWAFERNRRIDLREQAAADDRAAYAFCRAGRAIAC